MAFVLPFATPRNIAREYIALSVATARHLENIRRLVRGEEKLAQQAQRDLEAG